MAKLGLVINEDNSHFFGTRSEADLTRERLPTFVDQYAGTQVSHLVLNPNAMRTSYRSKVWDFIGDVGNQKVPCDPFPVKWVKSAQVLDERGLNPYTIWIARCREKGISPWLTMRMNDIHGVNDPTNFMHSRFWLEHPEYRRVPDCDWDWIGRAFDYGHAEVREHHMKLIREYFEMYDFDGLELDWMRFGFHFRPGHEEEGAEILTGFTRQVRELADQWAKKRGHQIKLGARVPARPMAARGLGMDGVRWVKEGLIDVLVPTPFWATADLDIPIELWRELIGPAAKNIVLAAGLEILLRPYPAAEHRFNDLESARGFTAAMLDRGADQIYLFNYMDCDTGIEVLSDYPKLLNQCGSLDTVLDKPRRHVVTYTDTFPPGVPVPCILPQDLKGKGPAQIRLYTGPRPQQGKAVIRIGLSDKPGVRQAKLTARLNSEPCQTMSDGDKPQTFSQTVRMAQFDVPLSAMKRGYNLIEVFRQEGEPQQIVWAEIRIDPRG